MEAANLANNHTIDYGAESYTDTIVLEEEGINAFGNETAAIVNVKVLKWDFWEPMNWHWHMDCEEEMIKNIEVSRKKGHR